MTLPLVHLQQPNFGLTVEAVLARQIPPRTRSLIRIDPVEAEVITNTLKPEKPWEKRADSGWHFAPAGYVWVRVLSPQKQLLQLNVSGASMAYVNGEPRVGDVYGYGTFFIPVLLKQGLNDILVTGFRGEATLNWRKAEAEIELDRFDATLPDFRSETGSAQGSWGGFVVRNNSDRPRTITLNAPKAWPSGKAALPSDSRLIPPLGTIKVPIPIPNTSSFEVVLKEGSQTWARKTFTLQTRKGNEPYKRTFRSGMDGSAQYYAVNPSSKPNPKVAVLSLHGASVEAIGQAQAYGEKDFCDLICPTNRRPFGFNWEGIGRKDALEVLAHAQSLANYDPNRIMLTGHSMGGHGAWHLGSHYPNLFAAVAPCAGWISFDTYAGGAAYDLSDPIQRILARTNSPSNPLLLRGNFSAYQSVYIHHGGADETVPVTEARRMRDELAGIAKVTYSEVPGMGHWFDNDPAPGADSVDWKPMFDMFRTAQRNDPVMSGKLDFRTLDTNINGDFGLGALEEQEIPFEVSRIYGKKAARGWELKTENIRRIFTKNRLFLDGQQVQAGSWIRRKGKWVASSQLNEVTRHGWNSIYANHVRLAIRDDGPAFIKWAWTKVRYDAEQLWYRANATPEITLDSMNVGQRTEIQYRKVKATKFSNFAAFTLTPGAALASIGGDTALGLRFTERFPLFSPGVAYPDELIVKVGMLRDGAKSIEHASNR